MTKKMVHIISVILLTLTLFSGCAGVYIGGGAAYVQGGGEEAVYRGISVNSVRFPKLSGGMGYAAELGKAGDEGTAQISYTSADLNGTLSGSAVTCRYSKFTAGGRFLLGEDEEETRFSIPVNISYIMLSVPDAGFGSSGISDVNFTGLGLEAGLGLLMPLGDNFILTADGLFVLDSMSNASLKGGGGKMDESILLTGPALRAGLYFKFE